MRSSPLHLKRWQNQSRPQKQKPLNQSNQPASIQPLSNSTEAVLLEMAGSIKELSGMMAQFLQVQMQNASAQPPATATRAKPSAAVPKPVTSKQEGAADNPLVGKVGTVPKTRGRYRSGEDEEMANRAIDAVITHNNTIGDKDFMWRMTNNAIKNLIGSSNQRSGG